MSADSLICENSGCSDPGGFVRRHRPRTPHHIGHDDDEREERECERDVVQPHRRVLPVYDPWSDSQCVTHSRRGVDLETRAIEPRCVPDALVAEQRSDVCLRAVREVVVPLGLRILFRTREGESPFQCGSDL